MRTGLAAEVPSGEPPYSIPPPLPIISARDMALSVSDCLAPHLLHVLLR